MAHEPGTLNHSSTSWLSADHDLPTYRRRHAVPSPHDLTTTMNNETWNKINDVFAAWLELEGEEQARYLDRACGGDPELRKEVDLLIEAHRQEVPLLETHAVRQTAMAMAEGNDLQAGRQIGAYRIVKEIGRGGMGAVYLAERADEQFQKQAAIKLIKRGMDTDQVLQRFRMERQILAGFDHPNIARLLDGGSTENGLPYFVMEYVEGSPIHQYCDEKRLSITNRLQLFRQVCAAVDYAHRNLVVHRDIKPSNIFVTAEGVPKLLDFGIAKILLPQTEDRATATGMLVMTPEYASPEQAQGANVTTASDVYSLGIVLYELLTGHPPYHIGTVPPLEVARIISESRPQLPSTVVNTQVTDDSGRTLTPESVSRSREGTPERLRRRLQGDLDNIVLMALRKEPQRRYQSAEQFSEDIRRHLEGLPVTAHPDTFGYRASKFIKRNKAVAAAATFALLALAVAAGIAGMVRWRANQQARSFQEFGQEVTRMEATMRYAYLLPLHDVQQEKQDVADRLELVKTRMQELGTQAYGPGYYALGRGYLALHRYQDAYDHLKRAWDQYEYREAPVAGALGYALALLYREKLSQAQGLYSKEQLVQEKARLEKEYRDPALQYLQSAASVSEDPEYVKALIAFMEKRNDEGLKHAGLSAQKITWLYEANLLQGQILTAQGNDLRDTGKTEAAQRLYEQAKSALLEAAKKGQSDSQVYEGLCALQSAVLLMQMTQSGISPRPIYEEGVAYCGQALAADSSNAAALVTETKLHVQFAYYLRGHGETLRKCGERAIQCAKAALQIEPENPTVHLMLGNAYSTLADEELALEGNPLPYVDLAQASYETALSKSPEDAQALYNHGGILLTRGRFELSQGKDPRGSLQKAAASLDKAVARNSSNSIFLGELGLVYWIKARYEIDTGLDATESLKKSIDCFQNTVRLNPGYTNGYIFMGAAYIYLADLQFDRDEDPVPALDQAVAIYNKTLETDSNNAYTLAGIGFVYWKKADWQQRHGGDPQAALEQARDALKKSIQFNKNLLECYSTLAEVEMIAARYAIARHANPESFFARAEAILEESLAMNPKTYESLGTLAGLCLLRAEYYGSLHQPNTAAIKRGIDAADRAIAVNSGMAETHATRGQLYLLRTRGLSGAQKAAAASTAQAAFLQAFKIKGTIQKKYAADLEEAKRLTQ